MKKVLSLLLVLGFCSLCEGLAQVRTDLELSHKGYYPFLTAGHPGRLHVVWEDSLRRAVYQIIDTSLQPLTPATRVRLNGMLPKIAMTTQFGFLSFGVYAGFNMDILGYYLTPEGDFQQRDSLLVCDEYADALRANNCTLATDDSTVLVLWSGQGPLSPFLVGIYGHFVGPAGRRPGYDLFPCDTVKEGQRFLYPCATRLTVEGDLWVCWLDDGALERVYYRRLSPEGVPRSPVLIVNIPSSHDRLWSPAIAPGREGTFVLAWSARDASSSDWGVFLQVFDSSGIPLGEIVRLNRDSVSAYAELVLSSSGTGTTVAVWEGRKDGRPMLSLATFQDTVRPFSPPSFRYLEVPDSLSQTYPSVVIHGERVFVAYKRGEGIALSSILPQVVGVNPEHAGPGVVTLPEGLALSQNYPNPFNSQTRFIITLPRRAHVNVSVFNTLGQKVRELINGVLDAGYHTVLFDTKGLGSGPYFCRMETGRSFITQRLILLK